MSADKGAIAGRVVDANGAPVKGATVTVSSATQPVSDIASLTDGDGRFRRGGLAPGPYTLTVMSAGHEPQNLDVNVAAGQETGLEVRL